MKCNLECPYSKPNGRDTNGNQSIICESRKWFMTDVDECIEKFDEKTISNLKRIFGDGAMPKEKFRVFTELPTNEKMIVNMITDDNLTLEDACNLLNNQDQQIKELKNAIQKLIIQLFKSPCDNNNKDYEVLNKFLNEELNINCIELNIDMEK